MGYEGIIESVDALYARSDAAIHAVFARMLESSPAELEELPSDVHTAVSEPS